jgi:hypothetical protein
MAKSPAHRLGQDIGLILEEAVEGLLRPFADQHGLYLDRRGARRARGRRRRVLWTDMHGNDHALDLVLERGGTDERVGDPVAFVETAFRGRTKHSRNKAQELQGALQPLGQTFHQSCPFLGVVLAGVFTDGAITQLASHCLVVVHLPEQTVVRAFASAGVDVGTVEATETEELERKAAAVRGLTASERRKVADQLVDLNRERVDAFMGKLKAVVTRHIESVWVLPLRGAAFESSTVEAAVRFLEGYDDGCAADTTPVVRYEVQVRFSNGDRVEGQFARKGEAVGFLQAVCTT